MKKRSPGLKSNKTGEKHIFVMENNVQMGKKSTLDLK